MALAERRNYKDFVSVFSCQSWEMLKVFVAKCYFNVTDLLMIKTIANFVFFICLYKTAVNQSHRNVKINLKLAFLYISLVVE